VLRCMSLLLAHRVISRARNNQVAFGEKRTSAGRQNPLTWSQMTQTGSSDWRDGAAYGGAMLGARRRS
jgi:hypothetical protein